MVAAETTAAPNAHFATVNTSLIFDVGAHRGEDTKFYLKKGFRVVAIEANPELTASLRSEFSAEIDTGQLTVVECAIAFERGKISFFKNEKNSVWGTTSVEWAKRNEKMGAKSQRVEVAARTFQSILSEHGIPHYLKVDVEGMDMECIHSLRHFPARPTFVSIESNKVSWQELLEEFATLTSLGYTKFKIVDQRTVPDQEEPSPALEGGTTSHRFPFGSSGLFGNDLPGEWLTADQAISRYRRIFLWYKLLGDNTWGSWLVGRIKPLRFLQRYVSWYDTHATR